MLRRFKGFTLIELLIVVAIIAILAAIAVPNFLEAQTRAKVSRAKSDMRTLSIAIETYYIDNNTYPADGTTDNLIPNANDLPGASAGLKATPTFRIKSSDLDRIMALTTPLSYVTSHFPDPFTDTPGATYAYCRSRLVVTKKKQNTVTVQGQDWITASFGPDTDEKDSGDLVYITDSNGVVFVQTTETSFSRFSTRDPLIIGQTYDPTNGTISEGDVIRVKQ